ncbi:MAG: ABC transporter ATP-binding protein, partial [Bacilli bacterium]|nr:ABC transporter ATP-binding protein [Bacilli bacterium]
MGKMLKYLKPYWLMVIVIFVLVSMAAIGQLLLPDYMSRMIGEGITPVFEVFDSASGEFVSTDYCDIELGDDVCRVVGQESDLDVIVKYGGMMLVVTLISSAAWIGLMYFSSNVSAKVGRDIRSDLYKKINAFSLVESEKFGTSTLITRSTNDVMQIQNYLIMLLRMVLRVPIVFIGALILSWQKSPELTSVLFWGIPLLTALIVIVFIIVLPLFKALQKKVDKITQVTRESINGVRVIRAFNKGHKEVERFKSANEDLTGTVLSAGKVLSVMNPAVNLIFNFVILGVIYAAFTMITGGIQGSYQG